MRLPDIVVELAKARLKGDVSASPPLHDLLLELGVHPKNDVIQALKEDNSEKYGRQYLGMYLRNFASGVWDSFSLHHGLHKSYTGFYQEAKPFNSIENDDLYKD